MTAVKVNKQIQLFWQEKNKTEEQRNILKSSTSALIKDVLTKNCVPMLIKKII